MLSVRDYAQVRKAITTGSNVILKTSSYSAEHRDHVDQVLSLYLYELGLVHLHNSLAFCVHELAGNARNALMKRLWFSEQGFEITDRRCYAERVPDFRSAVAADPQKYLRILERSGYYIRFIFAHSPDQSWVVVENNTPLLPIERERIETKLTVAREFETMADAYAAITDFSEGAGLGIAMVLVMLRGLGLSADSLVLGDCSVNERVTRSTIILPRNQIRKVPSTVRQKEMMR